MPLGRKVSQEIERRYAADRERAATLRDKLGVAQEAERALRAAQTEHGSPEELRALATAYDQALLDALLAAEAAERAVMGPKAYPHGDAKQRRMAQIAARKARATPNVRPWTDEVDLLRTLREAHKLTFRTSPGIAA